MLRLGDTAPDFDTQSTFGALSFHEWLGDSWGILFSHPADFTPVCTTEIGALISLEEEFAKRNTRIAILSVDPLSDHERWLEDIESINDAAPSFPLIADPDGVVAEKYGMFAPNADKMKTVRSVFIIDSNKVVRLIQSYPATTGRNFAEILRVLDSLQLTTEHWVGTPADWQPGERVVLATSMSEDEADEKYPGYETVKPYLRIADIPSPEPV